MQEPPENVKEYEVRADSELSKEEKETTLVFPNDTGTGTIFTDVPTIMKWILSIVESEVIGVRINESGKIIGVKAKIPKGVVKLQGDARQSNSHSQMVSYGPNR